jgi:hypothetical protein
MNMDLASYFKEHHGTGVLATADSTGRVNTAIYSRPHVFTDKSLGLIMRDRLSRKNIHENPHAGYLFREEGEGYHGLRLWLKMLDESDDAERIAELSRRKKPYSGEESEGKYLVRFAVEKGFVLIGGEELEL